MAITDLEVQSPRKTATVTIANGASLSGAVDLQGYRVASINMPGTWTAASLTFQVSSDNSTFLDLYDPSGEVTVSTAAASRALAPDSALALALSSHRYIKVRSGTSGSAVNQAADRSITLVLVPA